MILTNFKTNSIPYIMLFGIQVKLEIEGTGQTYALAGYCALSRHGADQL